jgi:hypothetical protein
MYLQRHESKVTTKAILSKSAAESAACLTSEWKNGLSAADHLVLSWKSGPSAVEQRSSAPRRTYLKPGL